jgi:hypothetical protein
VEVRTVPVPNAASTIEAPISFEEPLPFEAAPPVEHARYEPRFRVVTRKPLPPAAPRRTVNPIHSTLALAMIPAAFMLAYILFWTMAMRGGYYKDRLVKRMQKLQIEQAELEAEKHSLQSPGPNLWRARNELGMVPADSFEYRKAPVTSTPTP